MGLKAGSIKKVGKTISHGSKWLDPVGGTLIQKGVKAAGMNPDDPLNLDKRYTTAKADAAAKDAEALAEEQRAAQKTALAELDEEENRRIKKLMSGSRGMRGYRGGLMFRSAPSNKAGTRSAAGGGSAAPGAAAMRAGGAQGGMGSGGSRAYRGALN